MYDIKKVDNMQVTIWHRNMRRHVDPSKPPSDTRMLDGFLFWNNAAKCFVRAQGGWYKITRDCKLLYVTRTLYLLSLKEWLEIAKNDNFIANTQ